MSEQIFLTGFMGTGKSKIGLLLARRLQREFLDTDRMIEERAGQSIPEIFDSRGEEAFRSVEHQCLQQAVTHTAAVVALGGGAITRDKNWELIRDNGILVCLEATPETILERVSRKEDRPLLAGLTRAEKLEKIRGLLGERAPYYNRADIKITSTDDCSPDRIAADLAAMLESRSCKP